MAKDSDWRRGECIFCKSPLEKGKAREHVIPKWLLDRLAITTEGVELGTLDVKGNYQVARTHPLNSFLLGRTICPSCNHGWMSDLEKKVEEILWPLVDGERISLRHLSDADRLILARWVLKTAYVLSHSMESPISINPKHLHLLASNAYEIPNGVAVFANFATVPHSYRFAVCSNWPIVRWSDIHSDEDLAYAIGTSYKVVIQLEWIVLQVAFWSKEGFQLATWQGLNETVWPEALEMRNMGIFKPLSVTPFTYFNESVNRLWAVEENMPEDEKITGPVRTIVGRTSAL